MSVGSGNLGTGYSRLPQLTSDIETSEDEVSQHENLIYYRKLATPKKSVIETTIENNGHFTMGEYHPLGHDGESCEVRINGFNNINYNYAQDRTNTIAAPDDEMMILGTVGPSGKIEGEVRHGNLQMLVGNQHPMSVMRRVAFVMSICLCIFTIVAFLWVLPCDWATCSMMAYKQNSAHSWKQTLRQLELIGGVNIVPSGNKHHNNLVFMVKGEASLPSCARHYPEEKSSNSGQQEKGKMLSIPRGGGGIVTLKGSTGEVVWYKILSRLPRDMDCSLVDLDGNGVKDCLLVGGDDLLFAFNPISLTTLWFLQKDFASASVNQFPVDMDFPLILPDLDGDNISELLVTCSLKSSKTFPDANATVEHRSNRNHLVIISGRTGILFGTPFEVKQCTHVHDLAMDKKWIITFACKNGAGQESVQTQLLEDLHAVVKNQSSSNIKDNYGDVDIKQHQSHFLMNLSYIYQKSVSGRKLSIANRGQCPEACSVYVRVVDERLGKNDTVWNDGGKNMSVLQPATFSFNSHPQVQKLGTFYGPIAGFVLKFWHWTASSSSDQSLYWLSSKNSDQKTWVNDNQSGDISKSATPIGNQDVKNRTSSSIDSNTTCNENGSYTAHWLKERIVLVTLNDTGIHPVNVSEREILQLCTAAGCRPSLEFQEQSLLIADLDEDGSQELVSYLTTYEAEDNDRLTSTPPGKLQLVSKIQLVRLEAELPQLFEMDSSN